jgi:ABC-type sugar transport systems, permease components
MASRSHRLLIAGFLAPSLLLLAVFVVAPVFWAIGLSLTNETLTGPDALAPRFVGLANYGRLLADDEFYASFLRTGAFVFFSALVGQFVLGLLAALLLARPLLRGKGLFGAAILLPLVVPETVASLAWASMLAPAGFGTINRMIGWAGLTPIGWLQAYPMQSIIVINIWRGIAFAMILFQAALEGIPRELTEAAQVDGASAWQQLRLITLPLIRGAIVLYMLLTTIATFGVFGLIYFLTRGGPGTATSVTSIYIYKHAFNFFEIGLGSAASVMMLAVVLVIGLVYVRLLRAEI